jgi:glycerol-3-phosphate acyltransferase PlsY
MATLVGVMLGLHPLLLASVAGVFVLAFLVSGIVSIASMAGAMATPFFAWFLFGIHDPIFLLFTTVIAVFVPFMHRKNIKRLLKGEEKRFTLKKKK